jgi:hypothetical protein
VRLPTPDCPWCARRVEDRGDHFACCHCASPPPLPEPEAWCIALAAAFGENARLLSDSPVPLPNAAYIEARWAARAAMRAVPGLRDPSQSAHGPAHSGAGRPSGDSETRLEEPEALESVQGRVGRARA